MSQGSAWAGVVALSAGGGSKTQSGGTAIGATALYRHPPTSSSRTWVRSAHFCPWASRGGEPGPVPLHCLPLPGTKQPCFLGP